MARNDNFDLKRRFLLAASAGLLMPRLAWAERREPAVLSWKLDEAGDVAHEAVSGTADAISSRTGHAIWVGKGRDRALRLDGYSVWVNHSTSRPTLISGTMTVTAWLALESYPVDDAALIQLGTQSGTECRFSVDKWGHLHFTTKSGKASGDCKSTRPIPRAAWVHVAATFSRLGTTIYQNGEPCGNVPAPDYAIQYPYNLDITLGKSGDCPVVAGIFPTGALNGLIKDVQVFDGVLSRGEIELIIETSKPSTEPDLDINGQWCADDKQRPVYHAMPPRAWTNEPHGLVHWGGEYHLFYQKNANGPYWGHINWGHMTSPDLYRWTEMPVALAPEPGPDSEGCWSGSAIVHDGKLALIYTGGDGHKASICLALSSDGTNFTKYSGNPIIPAPPQGHDFPEFRDPFVWREDDGYYLIIGSAVKDVGGTALLYRSKDLLTWEFRKTLLVGDRETSGVFWEMPVFVKVGDDHVLIVCEVPGRASYWVGKWRNETFTPYSNEPRRLELFNHLLSPTPYTNQEGEVITMGIIPDQRSPKDCWAAGWAHLYSLPRVLSTDSKGHLFQSPLEGIHKWSDKICSFASMPLQERAVPLEKASGTCLNIRATFRRGDSESVSVLLRRSANGEEQTVLRYEWAIGRLVLDRTRSSLDNSVKRDVQDATFFPAQANLLGLNIYLDESVIEVFVGGRAALATRIYPTLATSDGIAFECVGQGAQAENIVVARIGKPS